MQVIMIPNQYPNYYKALEIYTGYYDTCFLSQQYRNIERLLYYKCVHVTLYCAHAQSLCVCQVTQ